jgi:methyl acetate hydrolase
MSFYPSSSALSKKMACCERVSDGSVKIVGNDGFGMDRPTTSEKISKDLPSGGAGLYGPQKSYLTFLRGILQSSL